MQFSPRRHSVGASHLCDTNKLRTFQHPGLDTRSGLDISVTLIGYALFTMATLGRQRLTPT